MGVRTALRIVFLVVLVGFCLTAWVAVRGWLAKDHLQTSADLVVRLQTQLERGDVAPAQRTLRELQSETQSAANLTGDRVWRWFGHLPRVGDDLQAVHIVAVSGHTLSTDALPAITAGASDVHRLRNTEGDVTPKQLVIIARRLQAPLATARAGVSRAQEQVAAVDPATLFGPVRTGVQEFNRGLTTLSAELASLTQADNAVLKLAGAATA